MSAAAGSRRRGALLLAGALVVLLAALPAFAGDDGPEARPVDAKGAGAEESGLISNLEQRLWSHDAARWALLVGRVLPILVGLALLIAWYLERDKIRGGALPPKPRAVPTLAVGLGEAVLWSLAGLQLAPYLVLMLVAGGEDIAAVGTEAKLLTLSGCEIAVAILLLLRRQRMQLSTPAERRARLGPQTPDPTPPPGWSRALGLGWWTFCVASVVFVPAILLWAPLLQALGVEPVAQEPVRQVVERSQPEHLAVMMALFGVLVAPFAEEAIFRGMLYPAVKRSLGGGRRGMWGAALLVSLIFAGVHGNAYAVLPLFALALVLTWVFETTNSLAAVIFAHAIHNGITMVPLLLYRFSA